jgi:hypothetical protein
MEIKEIINHYLDLEKNILDVTFKTIEDDEDESRTDRIDYLLVIEYGYDIVIETLDFFNDSDDDDEYEINDDVEIDDEELISFLNEYYTVNPNSLPKKEIL